MPYWTQGILPDLRAGMRIVVVAHGNSIRALLKYLKGISDEDIPQLNIPTGIPLVVELDNDLRYVSDRYLGDQAAAEAAARGGGSSGGIGGRWRVAPWVVWSASDEVGADADWAHMSEHATSHQPPGWYHADQAHQPPASLSHQPPATN